MWLDSLELGSNFDNNIRSIEMLTNNYCGFLVVNLVLNDLKFRFINHELDICCFIEENSREMN